MFYPLKLQHNPDSKVFVFSDFHYNHNPSWDIPLWKMRGYDSVHEHNGGLMKRWNDKISNNDKVFLLGDTVFGKDAEQNLEFLFKNLNFRDLYIMPGNHVAGYKQHYEKAYKLAQFEKDGSLTYCINMGKLIHFIPNYFEIFVNGKPIVLSHYPMRSWNGHAQGSVVLHGHVHGSIKDSLADTLDRGKILDVGPESVKEPLDFDEIMAIMDKKQILNESHHIKSTQTPFC